MIPRTDLNAQSATQIYLEQASREFAGDARTQVAVSMIEYANESRQSAREQRLSEEQHQRTLEAEQVAAMHREADQIRQAGMARGVFGIAGGGLQAAGGVVQVSANAEPSNAPTADGTGSSGAVDWTRVLEGGGQMSTSVGELVGAHHDGRAADAHADQTAFGHRVNASERRGQALNEDSQEAAELQRGALEHLESISDAEANGAQAAIFRG